MYMRSNTLFGFLLCVYFNERCIPDVHKYLNIILYPFVLLVSLPLWCACIQIFACLINSLLLVT